MGIPEIYTRKQLNALYRAIPLKDATFRVLRKYFSASANLYGIIPLRKLYDIVHSHNPNLVTKDEFIEFAKIARHEREGYYLLSDDEIFLGGKRTPFLDYEIIDRTLIEIDISRYNYLKKVQFNKPFYIPNKKTFLQYSDPFYYNAGNEVAGIRSFLKDYLSLEDQVEQTIYGMIIFGSRCLNISFETLLSKMEESGVVITNKTDLDAFEKLYGRFYEQTRMQTHRGHTPKEIAALEVHKNMQSTPKSVSNTTFIPWASKHALNEESNNDRMMDKVSASSKQQKKIGRNEPCPCGSGKKYKRCCGLLNKF